MSHRMIARARPGGKQTEIPAPAADVRIARAAAFAVAGEPAETVISHRDRRREHHNTR